MSARRPTVHVKDVGSIFFQKPVDSFTVHLVFANNNENILHVKEENSSKFRVALYEILEKYRNAFPKSIESIQVYNGNQDLASFRYTNDIQDIQDMNEETYACAYCEDTNLNVDRQYIRMNCAHKIHFNCWLNYSAQFGKTLPDTCVVCKMQALHVKLPRGFVGQYYFRKDLNPDYCCVHGLDALERDQRKLHLPLGRKRAFSRSVGNFAVEIVRILPKGYLKSK